MISTGKDLAFWRNIMIMNGVVIMGRMKPSVQFKSLAFENIWNSGTIVATCGTIMASRRMEKSLSFHLS